MRGTNETQPEPASTYSFLRRLGENEYFEVFIVLFFSLLFVLVLFLTTPRLSASDPGDHQTYIAMSEDPFSATKPPFAYRIMIPFIVWLVPLNTELAFFLITIASLILLGLVVYLLLKSYVSKIMAFMGVTLFYSLEFGPRFMIYDFWLPDACALLSIMLCFLLMKHEKPLPFALVFGFGVLCKEITLFVIPVIIMKYVRDRKNHPERYHFVIDLIPGIIFFALARLIIPIIARPDYDFLLLMQTIGIPRLQKLPAGLYRYSITPWGLLLFVLPFFAGKNRIIELLNDFLIFEILVYSQLLIAKNIERLLIVGFYPILLASMLGVARICKEMKSLEVLSQVIAIVYFICRTFGNVPFDTSDPFFGHLIFSAFSLFLILISRLILERRKHSSGSFHEMSQ